MSAFYSIYEPAIATVFAAYDRVKIYRSATETGTYTEITTADTRPALEDGREVYAFADKTGDLTSWYKHSYFNSDTSAESALTTARHAHSVYVSVEDVRTMGILVGDADDATVKATIITCQQLLERITRQWFYARPAEFYFDGSSSDSAHFSIPLIHVEAIRINEDPADLPAELFTVYTGRGYPDDRKNPRIKLKTSGDVDDFFAMQFSMPRPKFLRGRQNQYVRALFGYVEEDMSAPAPIVEAMKRMIVERLANPAFLPDTSSVISLPPTSGSGAVVEEETDGHRIRYATAPISQRRAGFTGITSNAFVLDVFRLYKGPIGIAVPSQPTWG